MVYIYIWVTQKYFIPFGSLNIDSLFIYSTCLFSWLTEDINETKLYFHVVFPLKCFLSLFRWEGGDTLQSGGKHLQFSSVAQSCPTLWDPLSCSTPGFPVLHNFPEFAQTLTHQSRWCHPTTSSSVAPSPPAFNLSQHQGLFQWISSLHHVAKALELRPQHQFFQWIFRVDFL